MLTVALWTGLGLVLALLVSRRYRAAGRSIRLGGIVIGFIIGVVGNGIGVSRVAEHTTALGFATAVAALVSLLAAVWVAPRLRSRHDRVSALLLYGLLAALHAAVGLLLWRAADDGLHLGAIPEVRSRSDLVAVRDAPAADRLYGVLVEAAIPARPPGLADPAGVVAWYRCLAAGPVRLPVGSTYLPDTLTLEFDGYPLGAEGIANPRLAWGWPKAADGDCRLRAGDPVVVWSDIDRRGVPGTVPGSGLTDIRIVAYGNLDTFRTGAVPVIQAAGRVALALAIVNGVLAVVMVATALLTYRRLRRCGTDEPPAISVK